MKRRPPKSTLFPYPPLFRSQTCSMRKLILASLTISAALTVQAGAQSRGGGGSLQQRLTRLLDQPPFDRATRSEEHTSELQSRLHLVCRLLLEKKKTRLRLEV